jgi:hypothetical protein
MYLYGRQLVGVRSSGTESCGVAVGAIAKRSLRLGSFVLEQDARQRISSDRTRAGKSSREIDAALAQRRNSGAESASPNG